MQCLKLLGKHLVELSTCGGSHSVLGNVMAGFACPAPPLAAQLLPSYSKVTDSSTVLTITLSDYLVVWAGWFGVDVVGVFLLFLCLGLVDKCEAVRDELSDICDTLGCWFDYILLLQYLSFELIQLDGELYVYVFLPCGSLCTHSFLFTSPGCISLDQYCWNFVIISLELYFFGLWLLLSRGNC